MGDRVERRLAQQPADERARGHPGLARGAVRDRDEVGLDATRAPGWWPTGGGPRRGCAAGTARRRSSAGRWRPARATAGRDVQAGRAGLHGGGAHGATDRVVWHRCGAGTHDLRDIAHSIVPGGSTHTLARRGVAAASSSQVSRPLWMVGVMVDRRSHAGQRCSTDETRESGSVGLSGSSPSAAQRDVARDRGRVRAVVSADGEGRGCSCACGCAATGRRTRSSGSRPGRTGARRCTACEDLGIGDDVVRQSLGRRARGIAPSVGVGLVRHAGHCSPRPAPMPRALREHHPAGVTRSADRASRADRPGSTRRSGGDGPPGRAARQAPGDRWGTSPGGRRRRRRPASRRTR